MCVYLSARNCVNTMSRSVWLHWRVPRNSSPTNKHCLVCKVKLNQIQHQEKLKQQSYTRLCSDGQIATSYLLSMLVRRYLVIHSEPVSPGVKLGLVYPIELLPGMLAAMD